MTVLHTAARQHSHQPGDKRQSHAEEQSPRACPLDRGWLEHAAVKGILQKLKVCLQRLTLHKKLKQNRKSQEPFYLFPSMFKVHFKRLVIVCQCQVTRTLPLLLLQHLGTGCQEGALCWQRTEAVSSDSKWLHKSTDSKGHLRKYQGTTNCQDGQPAWHISSPEELTWESLAGQVSMGSWSLNAGLVGWWRETRRAAIQREKYYTKPKVMEWAQLPNSSRTIAKLTTLKQPRAVKGSRYMTLYTSLTGFSANLRQKKVMSFAVFPNNYLGIFISLQA